MTGADLAREYAALLRSTPFEALAPLVAASVPWRAIATAAPAVAKITAAKDGTFRPDPDGRTAFVLPVRVDNPLTPEAADPDAAVAAGAIADLIALHPRAPDRWVTRTGAAEWLGACGPQYLDPDPVPVRRSPLAWLRAGCSGLVILSREPAYRILAGCLGGIIAEDPHHAAELRRILERPWRTPR
jgi:hypothetical protein